MIFPAINLYFYKMSHCAARAWPMVPSSRRMTRSGKVIHRNLANHRIFWVNYNDLTATSLESRFL